MTAGGEGDVAAVRFVCLDCEMTGLDPRKDRLVSIGAAAVAGGEIDLGDVFEALLKVEHNTSAVTVHGITRDHARRGMDEPDAVRALLAYLGDDVLVGHHVGADVGILDAAALHHFGRRLGNRTVDTMDLALFLERAGAFAGKEPLRDFELDSLCARFGIVPHDRHTAPGDAFLTAQVFQRLLRLAVRHGRSTLDLLTERFPADAARY